MALETIPWDSSEHLKTEEDIQSYMKACLEEAGDDLEFIIHALGVVVSSNTDG